jgi:cytosine/adenosine deaminase-related metal-dependent hydrolase
MAWAAGTGGDRHTFVNHLTLLMEKLLEWAEDGCVTKEDVIKGTRTRVLQCMRAGLTHPFTSFYSIEFPNVSASAAAAAERGEEGAGIQEDD